MSAARQTEERLRVGGWWISVVRHDSARPRGAVLVLLPALGVPAVFYGEFARQLNARGLTVALVGARWQGSTRPPISRGTRFGFQEMVGEDIPAAVEAVAAWYPGRPLVLLGHSLGGQLAICYLARGARDERGAKLIDGVCLVAAGTPYFRRYGLLGGLRCLAGTHFMAGVAAVCGYWPGQALGFAGRQSARLVADWARFARSGRCPGMPEGAIEPVDLPVFAMSVDGDGWAPPSTVHALASALPGARVHCRHASYPKPAGHVGWGRDPSPVVGELVSWLGSVGLAE